MSAAKAYASLLTLERPVLTTAEVASKLGVAKSSATRLLRGLTRLRLVTKLRRGLWAIGGPPNPYDIVEYITAPYPSYISLWTALYEHDIISQVPRIVYVVSLDRSKRITTSVATFQIHHISPRLFGGFARRNEAPVATAEKALFDTVYLLTLRGKRSVHLPELDLSENFDERDVGRWIGRIASGPRQALVRKYVERIFAGSGVR